MLQCQKFCFCCLNCHSFSGIPENTTTTEKTKDTTTEKPKETTTEKANETATEKPKETTTEKPKESTTEKPKETTTETKKAAKEAGNKNVIIFFFPVRLLYAKVGTIQFGQIVYSI